MARILNTSDIMLDPKLIADPNMRLWAYNGIDCCATKGIAEELIPAVKAHPNASISYNFVKAMQAPALGMMQRGVCIQPLVRQQEANRLRTEKAEYEALLNKLAHAVWERDLSASSTKQLLAFFYTALGLPVQYSLRKTPDGKKKTPSCDHKALEALAKIETRGPGVSPYDRRVTKLKLGKPFVTLISHIRDAIKKLAVVNCRLDADGRLRFSYNVVGTVTGRWSSSKNVRGGGTNGQNITEYMRRMVCADPGKKLGAPDLEQAESRLVAGLVWLYTGDDTYWRACESGDLHTLVCTMAYPERFIVDGKPLGGWDAERREVFGDLKACRAIADQKFFRHLSMRDLAKRIGHGSNYYGPPLGIAGMIGIPVSVVSEFQTRYFRAFPAIRKWHTLLIGELQTTAKLTTPLGRLRHFFKRLTEDSVHREAIAHIPQSTIGELLNRMLYEVWRYGMKGGTITHKNGTTYTRPFKLVCEILLQVHDSIVFQFPEKMEAEVIDKVKELMTISIPITRTNEAGERETRQLNLPLEFKTGWNWASSDSDKELFADGNPDGLSKYRGPGADTRTRITPAKPAVHEWLH